MSQFTLFPGILVVFRCQVSGTTEVSGVTKDGGLRRSP